MLLCDKDRVALDKAQRWMQHVYPACLTRFIPLQNAGWFMKPWKRDPPWCFCNPKGRVTIYTLSTVWACLLCRDTTPVIKALIKSDIPGVRGFSWRASDWIGRLRLRCRCHAGQRSGLKSGSWHEVESSREEQITRSVRVSPWLRGTQSWSKLRQAVNVCSCCDAISRVEVWHRKVKLSLYIMLGRLLKPLTPHH